jgi:hypothetical protein
VPPIGVIDGADNAARPAASCRIGTVAPNRRHLEQRLGPPEPADSPTMNANVNVPSTSTRPSSLERLPVVGEGGHRQVLGHGAPDLVHEVIADPPFN